MMMAQSGIQEKPHILSSRRIASCAKTNSDVHKIYKHILTMRVGEAIYAQESM